MGSKRKRSKRRSPTPEPRNYTYFADRNIDSPTFVDPLVEAGFEVERFSRQSGLDPREDSDVLWIRLAAEQGWIALSSDQRIGSEPEEIDAVMESGAILFVFTWGRHSNHALMAENFLRTAGRIAKFVARNAAPFIAKVSRPNKVDWERGAGGHVRMFRTFEAWKANKHRRRKR